MDLTYDAFVALLEDFRTLDKTRRANDKRRATRVHHRARIYILSQDPADGGAPGKPARVPAQLRDFSPRGMCAMVHRPMQRNDQFVVQLTNKNGLAVDMICRVTHCKDFGGAVHSVGAQFEAAANRVQPSAEDQKRIAATILG